MRSLLILQLIMTVGFIKSALCQPGIGQLSVFDTGDHDAFNDIYACADGGYIMCGVTSQSVWEAVPSHSPGQPWVVRVNDQMEEVWSNAYDVQVDATAISIIETDDGDFVVGVMGDPREYSNRGGKFIAFRISADGELEWFRDYGWGACLGVLELKAGDIILSGRWRAWQGERNNDSWLMRIGGDGQVVWSRQYDYGQQDAIFGIREGEDEIICAGYRLYGSALPVLLKVDADNGNVVWDHAFDSGELPSVDYFIGLVSSADGKFVAVGPAGYYSNLTKFDGDGQIEWSRTYDQLARGTSCGAVVRMSEGGFSLAGSRHLDGNPNYRPVFIRVNPDGQFRWAGEYDLENRGYSQGVNLLRSVVSTQDNVILGAGLVRNADPGDYDGMVMKMEPAPLGPRVIRFSPSDTILTVLTGDSIVFSLFAYGPRVIYHWTLDDTLLQSQDTLCTIRFDSPNRTYQVTARASDEDASITVRWHVTAKDFFIMAYRPDLLDMAISRGESVDFSIDTVRSIEDGELEYLWTKSNPNNPGEPVEAGTESRTTVAFQQSGNYSVEGLVWRGESSDEVTWQVTVRGAIWAFAPEELDFEVLPDSVIQFSVEPTIPNAEEQTIHWLVDGEVSAEDTTIFEWNSGQVGNLFYRIMVVVADTVEADTVTWEVTVLEPDFIGDAAFVDAPQSVAFLNVSPNPFNSTLTIRFTTGSAINPARLGIFDLFGREVVNLSSVNPSGLTATGDFVNSKGLRPDVTLSWNASSIPAGVYFVRLQSGADISLKKIVLIR